MCRNTAAMPVPFKLRLSLRVYYPHWHCQWQVAPGGRRARPRRRGGRALTSVLKRNSVAAAAVRAGSGPGPELGGCVRPEQETPGLRVCGAAEAAAAGAARES